MATIEVDWDVVRAITLRRETEDVTPNDVLRRLLQLPPALAPSAPTAAAMGSEGWTYGGVFFPNGTEFRACYRDKWHTGAVENGALYIDGSKAYSPSEAAQKITQHARNGWFFWECRLPGQTGWQIIDKLRRRGAI